MPEPTNPGIRGTQVRTPDLDWSQVRETMLMLELVTSPARRYNPGEWAGLQELISSRYTMVEERAMFDAVMHGVPVKNALENYMSERMHQVEASGGDIELF